MAFFYENIIFYMRVKDKITLRKTETMKANEMCG